MPDKRTIPQRDLPNSKPVFAGIDHWIFDLDNTLYPAECNLFRQIDARMSAFIQRRLGLAPSESRKLQKDYYVRYGTTLNGLMREHRVSPNDFLDFVHDIDVSVVSPNETLAERIASLPGRKFVFTNGTTAHADNVLSRLGLANLFDDIVDIEASGFTPKPDREAYARFIDRVSATPASSAMFEDIAINLEQAHGFGMTTVLVASCAEWMLDEPSEKRPASFGEAGSDLAYDYVHHVTDDLTVFLGNVVEETEAARAS